jgi:hypothetical protein
MNPTPPPSQAAAPAPLPAAEIARQLDIILTGLMGVVARHFRLLGLLTAPLWSRISAARSRLVRLIGHLAAGRLPRPRRPPPAAPHPPPPLHPPLQDYVRRAVRAWRRLHPHDD